VVVIKNSSCFAKALIVLCIFKGKKTQEPVKVIFGRLCLSRVTSLFQAGEFPFQFLSNFIWNTALYTLVTS
jgi:hypothetical protein